MAKVEEGHFVMAQKVWMEGEAVGFLQTLQQLILVEVPKREAPSGLVIILGKGCNCFHGDFYHS